MRLREAARIVALNGRGHVLLFQYARPSGDRFWATPGGGLEPDETYEQAAEREAAEELGIDGPRFVAAWERTTEFVFGAEQLRQHERYFVLRNEVEELPGRVAEFHRQEGILAARWWSRAELAATAEVVYPEDLHERLAVLPAK